MQSTLEETLGTWDGKHIDTLLHTYQLFHQRSQFWESLLVNYLEQPDWQVAITWLFKHHYDQKQGLADGQVQVILDGFSNLEQWQARLHILQLIPMWTLSQEQSFFLEPLLKEALDDDNKFVRAAAYEAYAKIVLMLSEQSRAAFYERCASALGTESASVKVKLRRVLDALG